MTLTLGFSPCPNDTFIFDALVNHKIDTEGLEFDVRLEDVETLNQWALQGFLDVSKISYGVLPLIMDKYRLLDAGGALGKGVGPLLISKKPISLADIESATIAIPGERTTAHLLFSLAFPMARNRRFMIFSDIEDAVLSGAVDCGVIIHENRFTYRQKGLTKVLDLGEFWEKETGAPIPLGGIVFRNDQPALGSQSSTLSSSDPILSGHSPVLSGSSSVLSGSRPAFSGPASAPSPAAKVNRLIRKSLEYAFSTYPTLPEYVKTHAQEMDEAVMRQHIDLYVNNYSLTLGPDGENAIHTLLRTFDRLHGREQAGSTTTASSLTIIH
ncbi:MAG TPA: 1,4-dihydroxy-6-naphthoate synthase [Puia sp.]|jgi:1,4-dihydroxy-6-naphthoate synthase|nr:1,4-dihydroxy-6-naphthoate synthase [Puia sp.]